MLSFLSFIFTFVLAIYIAGWLFRTLFPRFAMWLFKRQMRRQAEAFQGGRREYDPFAGSRQRQQRAPRRPGKKIAKDVGEYVEFEDLPGPPPPRYTPPCFAPRPQITDVRWEDLP